MALSPGGSCWPGDGEGCPSPAHRQGPASTSTTQLPGGWNACAQSRSHATQPASQRPRWAAWPELTERDHWPLCVILGASSETRKQRKSEPDGCSGEGICSPALLGEGALLPTTTSGTLQVRAVEALRLELLPRPFLPCSRAPRRPQWRAVGIVSRPPRARREAGVQCPHSRAPTTWKCTKQGWRNYPAPFKC